jgi:tol-pal system protein YbgF
MMRRTETLGILFALTLCGCAANGASRVDGGNVDSLSPQERRLQALENKVAQMQRRLDALNTTRFDEDNQRLRDDMRGMRGDLEKTRFDSQQLDKRNRDLYTDLDRRMSRLEGGGATGAAVPAATTVPSSMASGVALTPSPTLGTAGGVTAAPVQAGSSSVAGGAVVVSAPIGTPEEEGAYLAALDLLTKSGKYDDAIRGFRAVLDKWPNGRYAENAAYWMGEANYVKRDYQAALDAFQLVLNKYPNSSRAPEAMLKAGLVYNDLKQPDQSRAMLMQLIAKYPNSNAAKLAQQKLAAPAPAKR